MMAMMIWVVISRENFYENPKCVRVENEQTVDCELSISFIICYVLAVRLKMNG